MPCYIDEWSKFTFMSDDKGSNVCPTKLRNQTTDKAANGACSLKTNVSPNHGPIKQGTTLDAAGNKVRGLKNSKNPMKHSDAASISVGKTIP